MSDPFTNYRIEEESPLTARESFFQRDVDMSDKNYSYIKPNIFYQTYADLILGSADKSILPEGEMVLVETKSNIKDGPDLIYYFEYRFTDGKAVRILSRKNKHLVYSSIDLAYRKMRKFAPNNTLVTLIEEE